MLTHGVNMCSESLLNYISSIYLIYLRNIFYVGKVIFIIFSDQNFCETHNIQRSILFIWVPYLDFFLTAK